MGTTLGKDEYVFTVAPDGSIPLRPQTVTAAWNRIAKGAGVKVIRFHDARHTHASVLGKEKVPLKEISMRLGHSSIAITADIYSHLLAGMDENAAATFDAALKIGDQSATIPHK